MSLAITIYELSSGQTYIQQADKQTRKQINVNENITSSISSPDHIKKALRNFERP